MRKFITISYWNSKLFLTLKIQRVLATWFKTHKNQCTSICQKTFICWLVCPENTHVYYIINRPGVAGAVLQSPLLLIHSFNNWFSDPFPPNLQNIRTPKPEELGSWNFERMFTPHHLWIVCQVSGVTCQVSHVRCHMSGVKFFSSYFLFLFSSYKVVNTCVSANA